MSVSLPETLCFPSLRPPRPYGIRLPPLPLCGADGQGDCRPRAPGVALSPAVRWFVPSASWVPRNRMQVTRTGSLTWWGAGVGTGDPNCHRPGRGGRAPQGRPGRRSLRAGTLASGSSLWVEQLIDSALRSAPWGPG